MATKLVPAGTTKLSSSEKAHKAADRVFVSALKAADDAAALESIINRLTAHYRILRQEGDGAGIRFKGAKSHAFADQVAAAVDTFTRGMILKAD